MIAQVGRLAVFLVTCATLSGSDVCRDSGPVTQGAYTGRIGWESQADGTYTAASEGRTMGTVDRLCRYKVAPGSTQIQFEVPELFVSFSGMRNESAGSGLVIDVLADRSRLLELSFLRVAGEDTIRAGGKIYRIELPESSSEITFIYRLVDTSSRDPVRIDVRPIVLKLLSGRPAR